MADLHAPTELKVTTGAIRGSRKIHVPAQGNPDVKVAMREISLDPSCDDAPVRVYDTSGPYTDPAAKINIMAGLPGAFDRYDIPSLRTMLARFRQESTALAGRRAAAGLSEKPVLDCAGAFGLADRTIAAHALDDETRTPAWVRPHIRCGRKT